MVPGKVVQSSPGAFPGHSWSPRSLRYIRHCKAQRDSWSTGINIEALFSNLCPTISNSVSEPVAIASGPDFGRNGRENLLIGSPAGRRQAGGPRFMVVPSPVTRCLDGNIVIAQHTMDPSHTEGQNQNKLPPVRSPCPLGSAAPQRSSDTATRTKSGFCLSAKSAY